MNSKLPDRWAQYAPIGRKIEGTCFVALKVPLKEEFFRNRDPRMAFTPSMLTAQVTDLKTIVDLTNTNRYYDPQEFKSRNVHYEKIHCMGHAIPNDNVVRRFFSVVDTHLRTNSKQGTKHLIGVHCTHGINRTGYLICRYMISKLGFSPRNALTAFNLARGHRIERENYIHDLFNRAHGSNVTKSQGSELQRSVINRGPPLPPNWRVRNSREMQRPSSLRQQSFSNGHSVYQVPKDRHPTAPAGHWGVRRSDRFRFKKQRQ